jgi:hypothetical protein
MSKTFDYLSASIGPVVEGLEDWEKIYALEQAEYIPLRTLPGENGLSAITRWEPTDEQRQSIANGADILLEVFHFGNPLSPVRMMILDQSHIEEDAKGNFLKWFAATIRFPFVKELYAKIDGRSDG